MKIAFFIPVFPQLSETFILNQITGLIDRGHTVDIYARRIGNQTIVHEAIEQYKLMDRTFCRRVFTPKMTFNKSIKLSKAFMLFLSNLHQPLPLLKSLYKSLVFQKNVLDTYDIVHCHFGYDGTLGAFLKYVGLIRGKLLTTFYGNDISSYVKKHGKNVYNFLFEQCDIILSLSHTMKNKLVDLGCPEKKVCIHRLGVDMGSFTFSPRKKKKNGKVEIFTTARLVEKKGLTYGIEAVAQLFNKYPAIEYKIAGYGELKADLQNLINKLGAHKRIKLLGWKKQGELIEILKNTDIFLAPSVTGKDGSQEGTPTVLIESLAQGIPVISTYHSGIPEVVQDGISGFLVPERDVKALVEKLSYLIDHHEMWSDMGKAGRAYVEHHYDIDNLNDQLVSIYHKLLKETKILTNTQLPFKHIVWL